MRKIQHISGRGPARLHHISLTPIERRMGRLMRAPDHPSGESGGDNQGGNSGGSGGDSQSQNNAGDDFDIEAFFAEGGEGTGGAPSGESTVPSGSSSSTSDSEADRNLAQEVRTELEAMNFGDFVTPEIAQALQSGDPNSFNQAFQSVGRQIVQQSVAMSVGLMRHLSERMMREVDQRINATQTSTKDEEALIQAIPSAGSPRMGPTVKNIYAKALSRTGGDRQKAIQMTKDVLRLQAEEFGADLGLDVTPRGEHNAAPPTTNWSEALTRR